MGVLLALGWVTILASVLGSVWLAWRCGPSPSLVCLLATACLAVVFVPLARRRRLDLAEPLWLVLVPVLIGVTAKSFYVLGLGPAPRVASLRLGLRGADLLPATSLLLAGMAALVLGYTLGGGRRPARVLRIGHALGSPRGWLIPLVLAGVGLAALLVYIHEVAPPLRGLADLSSKRFLRLEPGGLAVRGYLRWAASGSELAFYLAFARGLVASHRPRSCSAWMALLGLLAVSFPIFVSSRLTLTMLAFRGLLLWTILRGTPGWRGLLALLVGFGATFVGVSALRPPAPDLGSLPTALALASPIDATVGSRNLMGLAKTAHVMKEYGGSEKKRGSTLLTWITAPIPRSWWPGKPAIGPGSEVGRRIYGTTFGSGVPPGLPGELWMNFGPLGVLLGLGLLGWGLRRLYDSFRPSLDRPAPAVLFVLLSTRGTLDLLGGSVSGTMVKGLQETLTVVAILALADQLTTRARNRNATRDPKSMARCPS